MSPAAGDGDGEGEARSKRCGQRGHGGAHRGGGERWRDGVKTAQRLQSGQLAWT
jgi:hypothetical protein